MKKLRLSLNFEGISKNLSIQNLSNARFKRWTKHKIIQSTKYKENQPKTPAIIPQKASTLWKWRQIISLSQTFRDMSVDQNETNVRLELELNNNTHNNNIKWIVQKSTQSLESTLYKTFRRKSEWILVVSFVR